jgi:glycosyltransferase involved in cell wall biosynthesis
MLEAMRTEGTLSASNKKRACADEQKRLRKLPELKVKDGRLEVGFSMAPILNVAPFPPYPGANGPQIRMADRLSQESKLRTVALAYPRDDTWWLEMRAGSAAGIYPLGSKSSIVETITQAAALVRAKLVLVEDIEGLPLNLIHGLENAGLRTILSIHDFVMFCRRPQLIEEPSGIFCDYSQDPTRCAACLLDIDPERRRTQADYRRMTAESLHDASLVIYPSVFLQRQHEILFPRRQPAQREAVVAPASSQSNVLKAGTSERPHVAFVGGVRRHRGAELIGPVMERVKEKVEKAAGFVYGDGEPEMFRALRKGKQATISGYYIQGTLASLFAKDNIAVAVLPSISPQAYSVVVDECLAAGVQVVAFDQGAVADRLGYLSVGQVVPLAQGAEGLAEAVVAILNSPGRVPDNVIRTLPQVDRVARKYSDLYRSPRLHSR